MTPRQKDCLDFVTRRIGETGIAPSYDEILDELGLSSKSSIARLVEALVDAGHLRRRPGRARSLELTGKDRDLSAIATAALVAELERRGWRNG